MLERLQYYMKKAEQGEDLKIAFIGGSITQGSLATQKEYTYAYRVYKWWCQKFTQASFQYINAGIGGTSSHYGVARVERDILKFEPDVVIIDFSVNEEATLFSQETFEGLIRKILTWPNAPAALVLNNVFYETGMSAESVHNAVANHYNVPFVSIKETVYKSLLKGEYALEDLTTDGLHPTDFGHQQVAEAIIKKLEEVYEQSKFIENIALVQFLPLPITANTYEKSFIFDSSYDIAQCKGFKCDEIKQGWIGYNAGDKITFSFQASNIAVQYCKTIKRPAYKVELILDGNQELPVILDGNFEEEWGDCLYLQPLLHQEQSSAHTIEIRVLPTGESATPFYLNALILTP